MKKLYILSIFGIVSFGFSVILKSSVSARSVNQHYIFNSEDGGAGGGGGIFIYR